MVSEEGSAVVITSPRYFGCSQQAGHYLFMPGMRSAPRSDEKLVGFDGRLAPQSDITPYICALSRLGGWGVTALSFWDFTVDQRPGSNSTFFMPDQALILNGEEMLGLFKLHFPEVWKRLPALRLQP